MKALKLIVFALGVSIGQPAASFGAQPETERVLRTPDAALDVGLAALALAKEIYPELDINLYSDKIDVLAAKAKAVIAHYGRHDPESVIRGLNTFLYKIHGLEYDTSPDAWEKKENYFLVKLLDTKRGTCANMPLLYMAIGQRLGYPIFPVVIPEHQFLRYVDSRVMQANIEATGGGGYIRDERYIRESRVTQVGLQKSDYLKTLTKREWLAHALDSTSVTLAKHGNLDRAIYLLERAVQLNPRCAGCFHNLGAEYIIVARRSSSARVKTAYEKKARRALGRAKELGYVKPFTSKPMQRIKEG